MVKNFRKTYSPKKSSNVTATKGMLYSVRDELSSRLTSNELATRAVEVTTKALKAEMRSGFKKMTIEMQSLGEKLISQIHRVELKVEDQRANNRYVLDGYANLSDRIDRLEKKIAP